jgi:hypothetical protein
MEVVVIDYNNVQLHAGYSEKRKSKIWHTDSKGKYWCGNWNLRTPSELFEECKSTIKDLLKNHPELNKQP